MVKEVVSISGKVLLASFLIMGFTACEQIRKTKEAVEGVEDGLKLFDEAKQEAQVLNNKLAPYVAEFCGSDHTDEEIAKGCQELKDGYSADEGGDMCKALAKCLTVNEHKPDGADLAPIGNIEQLANACCSEPARLYCPEPAELAIDEIASALVQ